MNWICVHLHKGGVKGEGEVFGYVVYFEGSNPEEAGQVRLESADGFLRATTWTELLVHGKVRGEYTECSDRKCLTRS